MQNAEKVLVTQINVPGLYTKWEIYTNGRGEKKHLDVSVKKQNREFSRPGEI